MLGDGIRRNIATVSKEERDRLRDAILALQTQLYGDGVSYWFKQDEIHDSTHVHVCPPEPFSDDPQMIAFAPSKGHFA